MDVLVDSDTGTVQLNLETKILKGAWDSSFSADVLVQRKTDLEVDWTTVDTITAEIQASMMTQSNVNRFRYEHSAATNWRFKHGSDDLSAETGSFGAIIYNI